jgi:hypothetical protein
MNIFKLIKNRFTKKTFIIDIPNDVDADSWCETQIMVKCMETGKSCYGKYENGKLTISID